MSDGGRVTVDADEALKLVEKLREDINELGRLIGAGFVTKPPSRVPRQEPETDVEIPTEGWTSYETKKEAGPYGDSWRFASDQDGNVHPEVEALVDRIYESGKVERGSFTYMLSKDGKFLQRRKKK